MTGDETSIMSKVPFEDFLMFLFQSASETSRKTNSYNCQSDGDLPEMNKPFSIVGRVKSFSCPDLEVEDMFCGCPCCMSNMIHNHNNQFQCINSNQDDNPSSSLSAFSPSPSRSSSSIQFENHVDGSDLTAVQTPIGLRITAPSTSASAPLRLLYDGHHDLSLSFYKNFSATSRSKSSCAAWTLAKNEHDLCKRLSRSTPIKLDVISNGYYDDMDDDKNSPTSSTPDANLERHNIIIDSTLSGESVTANTINTATTTTTTNTNTTTTTTMSLFLDAVHVSQELDRSPMHLSIFY